MNHHDDNFSPADLDAVAKLKDAYIQEQNFREDLAQDRALADVRRLAGKGDGSFDAKSSVQDKKGGFQTDSNEPEAS